jgi:hypothetical protein
MAEPVPVAEIPVPIVENKYTRSKIYKIVSNSTDKIYIGSTCSALHKRHHQHKLDFKRFQNGKHNNITSFQIIELGDSDIVLIEEFPCANKIQLHARERYHIENTECLNKVIPGRTDAEYYMANRETILIQQKQWHAANREQQKIYRAIHRDKINVKRRARYAAKKKAPPAIAKPLLAIE